jgi:aldose 1-epimerase
MRGSAIGCLAFLALVSAASGAVAGDAERAGFGRMPDGRQVEAITLTNESGVTVRIISLGAAIQSVIVPDRAGRMADVALGYPSLDGYLAQPEYFGATVGRVANRIAAGRFTLDGVEYQTPVNNGPNSLHGGTQGFDKVLWEVVEVEGGASPHVTLRYVSPDGDQGYPGTLTTTATYALNEANELSVDYRATTDQPTVVNISNHGYWNMAGEGSPDGAMGNLLTIPADEYSPTDATAIPTGEFRAVEGTVFDFRTATAVGLRVRDASDEQIVFGRGYDHNWVISRQRAPAPRTIATLEDPVSGRTMEVVSDQPGLQFYSGNFMDGTIVGKSGRFYRQGDSIVLEPQMFPDTPNRPEFGSVRLEPGQEYRNHIAFRFSARPAR